MTRFTRKVVAFVVTIALVLTTMGTVFATDNSATYQESANILKGYGVLVGDNGNLMLDQPLLRQDAVIISLRLMGIADEEFENYEIPSDFNDISNSYYLPIIGMAQDLGLIEGMGDGTFGFNQKITTQQIETILLRALGYEITDDIYADVPQMAAELGISNLVTAANGEYLTRDKVAQLMLNTLNTPVKGETQKLGEKLGFMQSAAISFTAVAATETSLKVTFNGAVADTAAATFAVKKDDVSVNVSSIAWNTAKTEATLTMVSKLTEGNYAITVGGMQLTVATATVAVKDEETGRIELLSDKAILGGADANDAYTFFKVYNQYGEDITEDASLTFTATGSTARTPDYDNGRLAIAGTYEADDTITVTALDETSGAFASKTLTVVDKAAADSVEIVKLYNDDEDATLAIGATGFELLLKVKDQYGNIMLADSLEAGTADAKDGLVISSSNDSTVDVDIATLDDVTIEDVDYIALPLTISADADDAGPATIRFISNTTGKTETYSLSVAKPAEVDTITLGSPSIAVAGEDVDFPVTAYDQSGKLITNAADLNDATTGVEITSLSGLANNAMTGTFVKEDGQLYLRVAIAANEVVDNDADNNRESDTMNIILTTATNKVIQKSVVVREAAVPAVVAKIQSVKTGIVEGNTSEIEASTDENDNNIVVYDQYDRAMDLDAAFFADYKLVFSVEDDDYVDFDGAGALTDEITAEGGTVDIYGNAKGSEKVTVEVYDLGAAAVVADSGLDFTVNVVEVADIVSYGVEDIDSVYAAAGGETEDYTVTVDVYGVLSNGAKVAIPDSMYSIISVTAGLTVANGNELDATAAGITWATDSKTATGQVVVTIGGAEGPVSITKDVAISKVTPKANTFELADGTNVEVTGDTAAITAANAMDNATAGGGAIDTGIARLLSAITVSDQYGIELDAATNAAIPTSIIFSNAVDADDDDTLVLTNGNALGLGAAGSAKIAGAEIDDTFTMTFVYANGKSVSMNVVIE